MEQTLRKYKNEIQIKKGQTKRPVKDITITRYITNMNNLMRDMKVNNIDFLLDYNKVFNHLSAYSDSTKKTYLNAIIEIMRAYEEIFKTFTFDLITIYKNKRDGLAKKLWEKADSNKATDKDKDLIITFKEYDDLIDKVDKEIKEQSLRLLPLSRLTRQEYNLMLRFMILVLYRYHPIRCEYADIKVVKYSDYKKNKNIDHKFNYLVMSDKNSRIYLYKHKNDADGMRLFNVDPIVHRAIKSYLPFRKNKEFLLSDFNGNPFSNNTLSKYIIKTFSILIDKPIGASTLRKIYTTNKHGKNYIDQKKDCNMMGNSLTTQGAYYLKKI